jgi:branched-chain amino acid transport system substrate-binding protein
MPLQTNDFSPIMQRIKDSGAEGVFAFLPSGPTTLGFVKAFNENGLKNGGVKFFAPGDLTQESDLPALGESALGLQTTFHYAVSHDSAENKKFVEAAVRRRSEIRRNFRSPRSAPMTACMSSTR